MVSYRAFARTRSRLAALIGSLLLFLLLLPGALCAADETLLTINMRNADISAVIQWVAEQTNKKIVVDPRVSGRVTVLANEPMTAAQAYQVFLSVLDVYGFAATESGGILRIFPAAMAKSSPADVIRDFQSLGGGEQAVYVFKARQVSAKRLSELLKPLVASSGYLAAYPDNNTLVIADESANVKRLVGLAEQLDQSGDLTIDVVKLQFASADSVAELVTGLLQQQGNMAFSIASDERSNSVLMSGAAATRQRVRQLLSQLDQPLTAAGNTRVIYLHYLDAAELLPILRGMSAAAQQDSKQADSAAAAISIEASESANAIIMTAPPPMLDLMAEVIAQVDIRRQQVLVEAVIVEVSKDFSQTIGVEWNTSLNNSDGTEAITNFGLRTVDQDGDISLLGAGLNLGFYRNGSLRALARAIANENDANILSTPSILTLDNQQAEILVGSNVPFITGQSTGSASSTSDPFTTIAREDIGLSLKITPQINGADAITLDILQEIETLTESTQVENDIVTDKRSIKTKVLVDDESILVLGGLISDDSDVLVRKVPFLGDLPLLGTLFRSETRNTIKRNLMVFIRPVIISGEQAAQRVTEKNYNRMKQLQDQYNRGEFSLERAEMSDFTEYKPRPRAETEQRVSQ